MAKKVGENKKTGENKAKKEKVVKVMAPGEMDPNGKYVSCPTEFNPKLHKALKKENFASGAGFLNYRAMMLELNASRLTALAADFRKRAEVLGKYKSDDQRKKAERIAKYEKLIKQMQEEIDAEEGGDGSEKTE